MRLTIPSRKKSPVARLSASLARLAIGLFLFSPLFAPEARAQKADASEEGPRHLMITTELGSSIDLGSHDMSTFDIDIAGAYTNDFIRAAGIGVGVHRSFGSNNTFIPVYALFQSSFTRKPSLLFASIKVGYSFSAVGDAAMFGDTSAIVGLGVNLAMKRSFRSHIILGFGYRHYNRKHQTAISLDTQNVPLANLAFGVSF